MGGVVGAKGSMVMDDAVVGNRKNKSQITFIVTSPQHKCLGE